MTNKPLIFAFSLVAGLMSGTVMAADFSASSSMNREVTPILINGVRDLAIWDNNGRVADPKETLGLLASDKVGTLAVATTGKADTVDAGSALVDAILAGTKPDKADAVRPGLAEGLALPRTDKYDTVAVATVAMAAPMIKTDIARADTIKYAEFDRADTVAADKPVEIIAATRSDVAKSDKVDKADVARATKVEAVADSRVTASALQQIRTVDMVADQKASIDDTIRVASLGKADASLALARSDIAKQDLGIKDADALKQEEALKAAELQREKEQQVKDDLAQSGEQKQDDLGMGKQDDIRDAGKDLGKQDDVKDLNQKLDDKKLSGADIFSKLKGG